MDYFAISNFTHSVCLNIVFANFCVYLQNLIDSNKNEKISNYHTSL